MKTTTLILFMILISTWGIAQNRNSLKGPEAKNYKPWQHKSTSSRLMTKKNRMILEGPAAKNDKVWNDDSESTPVKTMKRRRIFGPAAKNKKDNS